MKLIDKDALVAEIERRKEFYKIIQKLQPVYESNIEDCDEYLSFLDTLEVKEVDLEKEVTSQIRLLNGIHTLCDGKQWWKGTYNELSYFAKYFIELGLKI